MKVQFMQRMRSPFTETCGQNPETLKEKRKKN